MRLRRAALATLAGLALPLALQAAEELRFITCPVYRDVDAGRKSGCWLADHDASGLRYDVSLAPTKPDWNHEILVEGVVSSKQDEACGGVVLDPVRVSVLPGACTRHALPAEGFPGRRFVLPARNVRPLAEKRAEPPRPWTDRRFSLVFDFDRSFIVYQLDDYLLDQAITYIRAVKPARVTVTGYADTRPAQVSGRSLAEDAKLARQRAEMVAKALRRLGVADDVLHTTWSTTPGAAPVDGADGLGWPSRRRVDIDVALSPTQARSASAD